LIPAGVVGGVSRQGADGIECERNGEILNVCIFDDDTEDAEHGRTMGSEVFLRTLLTALEGL
jgi:hypothetical protein